MPRPSTTLNQQIVSWLLAALLLLILFFTVRSFLAPLTWALVLAIFFTPVHRRVLRRIPHPNLAALVTVLAVACLLIAPAAWLVTAFVREAVSVIGAVPSDELVPKIREMANELLARSPLPLGTFDELVGEANLALRGVIGRVSARVAGDFATSVFHLVVVLLAMFYLLRDGPILVDLVKDISPLIGDHHDIMMGRVSELISVTLSSGFVVAAVQGLLGGLVFAIIGLPSPIFWGVIIGFLAFVPVVGPWLVWIPAGAGLLFAGETGRGIAMLILSFVVVSGADNVLRPILIAGRSQLNGLLVFVSLLGGIQTFGLVGAVIGPIVVATAVGLIKGYRESLVEQRSLGPQSEAA